MSGYHRPDGELGGEGTAMGDLLVMLRKRIGANARRAVEAYTQELPEYRTLATDSRKHAAMLEFAAHLRRRTIDLCAGGEPFLDDDLSAMAAVGAQRAATGISLTSHRRVLGLHATLTLRELYEAAGPDEIGGVMHMLGWLAPQGLVAQHAYTRGYFDGQRRVVSRPRRMQQLAAMLLTGDAAAAELAADLGVPLTGDCVVAVVRIADGPPRAVRPPPEAVMTTLLAGHPVPVTWHTPQELVAMVPAGVAPGGPPRPGRPGGSAGERAESLVRDFAEMVERPCSAGTASGPFHDLAETVALARRISRAAPLRTAPSRVHTAADVFVELGATSLPQVDGWLREVARQLSTGPDLVATLEAYYLGDMNRLRTAAVLHIHPRTLDYRLRRVRELTGIDPGSTDGVRVLYTAVTRILAGAWSEPDPRLPG